jgi:hypothetical protein
MCKGFWGFGEQSGNVLMHFVQLRIANNYAIPFASFARNFGSVKSGFLITDILFISS